MVLLWWILSNVIFCVSVANGLKWVKAKVPRYQFPDGRAQLQCDYDLGNDTLYALKWYKEHEEFYRFVPKAVPQVNSYSVDGVNVNISASNSTKVTLHSINLKSSGHYRCEVSAEAPSFASAQSEAKMDVVSLPGDDPVIAGVELQYQIGKEVNLNCTSGKSHPASELHWYINEQLVKKRDALVNYPIIKHSDGLEQNVLGLKFMLDERHFLGGSMRIKCIASLSPLIWMGDDRQSTVQSLSIKDMREALLLMKSSSATCQQTNIILNILYLPLLYSLLFCSEKIYIDY